MPNFKAVGQKQAELHSLKVEKLDACIRPLSQIQLHLVKTVDATYSWFCH